MSIRLSYERSTPPSASVHEGDGTDLSDEALQECLELCGNGSSVAFSTGNTSEPVSLYDWHQGMGHRSMKTIVDMADGPMTGIMLKDIPSDI
jgi:hypothetical protein